MHMKGQGLTVHGSSEYYVCTGELKRCWLHDRPCSSACQAWTEDGCLLLDLLVQLTTTLTKLAERA